MLKIIVLVFIVAVVLFLAFVATRPNHFSYSRSALIDAPASVVFPEVNDLHKWAAWSPWAKMDPQAKNTFSGPEAGPGATLAWQSTNGGVGEGRMTIVGGEPNRTIDIDLEFIKPFAGRNLTVFTFTPEGDRTKVTWTMSGENTNFLLKAMGVLMNCEKMIGQQFDQGLADLKQVSEGRR